MRSRHKHGTYWVGSARITTWQAAAAFALLSTPLLAANAAEGASPNLFDRNLLVNGDAEAGAGSLTGDEVIGVPGWVTIRNFTVARWGAVSVTGPLPSSTDPGPPNRGQNLFSGGPGPDNEISSASQIIDVSQFADFIDSGPVAFTLSGFLGGWQGANDSAVMSAVFADRRDDDLMTSSIGPVLAADRSGRSGLLERSAGGTVPVGTRKIMIVLQMSGYGYNDGYADNLSLILSRDQSSGPPTTAIAPVVSRVLAKQRPGTQWVDITYDLADTNSARLMVSVAVSDDGGSTFAVPATSFGGDGYGKGVSPGSRKQVVWDAGRDWPNRFSANMRFRVTATDGDEPPNPNPPRLVWIPAGAFTMGSPASEPDRDDWEGPQTLVTLSRGFWLGKYEVTQREYEEVMGVNLSYFKGELDLPVEGVYWNEATNYCGKLTARELAAGRLPEGYEYRLPTEAQWEYACRAGTTTRFGYGDDADCARLGDYAWYWENSFATAKPPGNSWESSGRFYSTHPVGQKLPNAWGLYDMHGNVQEWCQDWSWDWDSLPPKAAPYPGGSVTDPKAPPHTWGWGGVSRGGSWWGSGPQLRSAYRDGHSPRPPAPDIGTSIWGFRAALVSVP